jgi:hypothetical protein
MAREAAEKSAEPDAERRRREQMAEESREATPKYRDRDAKENIRETKGGRD